MSIFTRNVAAIHIALVSILFAWFFGGTRGDYLLSFVPWSLALMLECMLFFPQRRSDENMQIARERVWEEMRYDPLVWISILFMVVLTIPFLNKGLCPICDYPEIMKGASVDPPVSFLPFCVDRIHHLNVYIWFAAALSSMVAVKHALTKKGKRTLLEILVWNGVALAALGFLQQATGAGGPFWADPEQYPAPFFSSFGYSNMAGDYFASMFALSFGLWCRRAEEVDADGGRKTDRHGLRAPVDEGDDVRAIPESKRFWRRNYMLIASAVLFFAAINTLSRSAIIIVSVAAVLLLAHAGTLALAKMEKARRIKAGALLILVLVIVAVLATIFTPDKVRKEMGTVDGMAVADRITGRTDYHPKVAIEIFMEHPLFGCGGWGYMHFSPPKVPKKFARNYKYSWSTGGANVHNDYLQFLCEHGAIGFGLLVTIVVLLAIPIVKTWRGMARVIRFSPPRGLPSPKNFFVFPAGAIAVLVSATGTLIHAFGDCPLRSPAILTLFFVQLAAIDGFLPRIVDKKKKD